MKHRSLWTIFIVFWVSIHATLSSQTTSSGFSGVVRDSSQAVITGAAMTVTNVETGFARTTETDSQGRYRIGDLPPGNYQVSASMAGFAREIRKGIVLQVGQEVSLNFSLPVGAVEQAVEVTGAAPVVETTTAAVTAVVSQEQLRELPLNGRSFTDLVTLQAATMTPTQASREANYGNGPQLSVAGARTDANNFMIDGTDMSLPSNGTPGSAARTQLGVDTIREYQVITSNPKAEFGRNTGGIINAVTRSGTNEWHGSVFEFLRNKALDARNFFNPGELPPFKRNQFGTTLGGPLRRDKSFFFLGYEGLRQRLAESFIYQVPAAAARRGILPDGTVSVDSRIVSYINLYPLPNGEDLGSGIAEYIANQNQPVGENFGSARMDYTFSSDDFLFGRYTISRAERTRPEALLADNVFQTANQYVTVQQDHLFGPNLLNTFRVGFNRSLSRESYTDVPGGESLGFLPGQPIGSIGSGDLSTIGANSYSGKFEVQTAFQYEDDLSYTRGSHTMKFGALAERFRWNTDQPIQGRGTITFSNLRNFLLAGPSGTAAQVLLPQSSSYRHIRTTLLGFFAQDDYRVSPNLALTLGVRWEFTTGLSETDGKLSYLRRGPDISDDRDLITGELWDNRIRNFEPRLGFNWAMGHDRKTVLSGGFGIMHNQLLHNTMISSRAQLPFYFRGRFTNLDATRTFPDIQAMIAAVATFRDTRHFDHDNFKTPTFYRYNLAVQRELPGQIAFRVGYVGAIGRHLARRQSLNEFPVPVRRPDGSWFLPPEPVPQFTNPDFNRITWMSSDVNSVYSGLTASVQKRYSRDLTFQASYTYSKSIDDYSSSESNFEDEAGSTPQLSPDRTLDRARSSFNVPHVFVANGVYELPLGPGKSMLNSGGIAAALLGGWQVGGILTAQQGIPFTVGSNASTRGYRYTALRPNLKAGIDSGRLTDPPYGTRERFFDPSAFSAPPPGTVGNAARNLLLGPSLKMVNVSLGKSLLLGERARLQFRSEFFNLFNHTNFANPQARVFTSTRIDPKTGETEINPSAGRVVQTSTTARQIQLALKLIF